MSVSPSRTTGGNTPGIAALAISAETTGPVERTTSLPSSTSVATKRQGISESSTRLNGTARAIAQAYSVFATGGRELGLRRDTLALLAAPAIPAAHGFYDECLKSDDVQFSLGFAKPSSALPFGSPASYGSPGAGGAFGFADPDAGVGYAYVTNRMGTRLSGDPRDVALRDALYAVIRRREGAPGHPGNKP